MNIFLDDWRESRDKHGTDKKWFTCKNADHFKRTIDKLIDDRKWVEEVSFDYDLGMGPTGVSCLKYLLDQCEKWGLDVPVMYVHSEYPGALEKFKLEMNTYKAKLPKYLLPEGGMELKFIR